MARRHQAPDPIEEIESRVDELAGWVVRHRTPVLLVVGLVLAAAAAYGIYDTVSRRQEREASAALARTEAEYREAMGAAPDAGDIPEPANPELAVRVRTEFAERYRQVADEHPRTSAAVLARLKAGNRLAELGELGAALQEWEAARNAAPRGSSLRGLVLMRLGRAHEEGERFAQAAAAFEEAGEIGSFPLRYHALADAARNHANAGNLDGAAAISQRIETEAPDADLPDHVRSRLRELRKRQEGASES